MSRTEGNCIDTERVLKDYRQLAISRMEGNCIRKKHSTQLYPSTQKGSLYLKSKKEYSKTIDNWLFLEWKEIVSVKTQYSIVS